MQLEDFALACAPKHVRSSSAYEHPTCLGAALSDTVNTVVINARCSLRIEADQRVIVVAGLPVHHYRAEDAVAEAYAMVFLVESGFAQQTDVARAFGRSVRTVRRFQKRYAHGGMTALSREEGWRRGRRRICGKRLRTIETLKSKGMSNRAIAHQLGVRENAIRKLVGPSKPAESAQLALPAIPSAAEELAAAGVPSATRHSEDGDGAARSAEEKGGDGQPATAPEAANDDEPVPMSLDGDAEDRTLDRQLAYLGLLDDAAPLFREGRRYPVSVCCWLCRVWSRVGYFGSAASSTATSVRHSMACARRC